MLQVLQRSQEALLDGAQGGPGEPGQGTGGLAHLLLHTYQERLIQNRLQEEQDKEDGALEEEEDEDDYGETEETMMSKKLFLFFIFLHLVLFRSLFTLQVMQSSRSNGSLPQRRRRSSGRSSSVRCTSVS